MNNSTKIVLMYCIILQRASGAKKEIFANEDKAIITDIYHMKLKQLIDQKKIKCLPGDKYDIDVRSSVEPQVMG